MLYSNFQDKKLSLLGFGAMRLPLCEDGSVDVAQTEEMMAYAFEHGVNYIDTAYPYHDGLSETIMGQILSKYPRESYYLATKYPGHQISASYNPAEIFEHQLEKCGVDYFDFYLLHNVFENSMETYLDPKWGILDYFKEQKRLGRIKHLGFSTHGSVDVIEEFLDRCGDDMEFCQIQLNYLDWTLQDAKAKYEMLTKRGIPVWVMEPVRGGKLVNLSENNIAKLKELRPEESVASFGFRFLQKLPNVTMVLSGMSNMEQMQDNIATFSSYKHLSDEETQVLFDIADSMKNSIPCTSCRYCTKGCPMGLDIPKMISIYNEIRFAPGMNAAMRIELLPEEKKPSACIACGKCTQVCPQGIEIPQVLRDFTQALAKIPSWVETSRQREAAKK